MICRQNPFEDNPIPPSEMTWHISNEIEKKNQPDGELFRRDSVDIVNHQDKIIHRGTLERRFFYALMSRSRGKESLVSWGFTGAVLTGQGKYTETLKNAVLLRDKSTAKE